MTSDLSVVVIFGATSDIGRACARDMARHGARLILIDEDEEALSRLAEEIEASPAPHVFAIRMTVFDDIATIASRCAELTNSIRLLVTCPMAVEVSSFAESAPESWERVVSQNLLGPIFAAKAFLPLLKAASGASVVHVGSIDGSFGNPQVPSYSVSKGGLVPLTHIMASELARFGIRVNCAARAMALQPDEPSSPLIDPLLSHTPLGRPANPREVAAVVRWLASEDASYVSGVVLPVDGGRTGITPGTRSPEEMRFRADRV